MSDGNDSVIAEFRAHEGRVGGSFEGAPLLLLHHTGRTSGKEYVAPMMYLPAAEGVVSLFASKAGAPDNPAWYENLVAGGDASVEIGTSAYPVRARDVTGSEREEVYAKQTSLYPGFAEYAKKTEGVRVIPVVELTRV